MKLTNTKYMIIENSKGISEHSHTTISWRNVAIWACVFGLIAAHLINWYL